MRLPWRREKTVEVSDPQQQRALKVEAGFGEIDTQEDLHARVNAIQLPFIEMTDILKEEANILIAKYDTLTETQKQLLDKLNNQIFNLILHKTNKIVATAWSIAGEDPEMSERYGALEEMFLKGWRKDGSWVQLLQDSEMYMLDISFRGEHVKNASHILSQTPIMMTQGGYNVTPTSQLPPTQTKPEQEARPTVIKR